jgi:PEP-CTERM motif
VISEPGEAMKKYNKVFASQPGHRSTVILVFIAVLFATSINQSNAQVTNLVAQNTSLQITLGGSSAGLSGWLVNGVNQLDQQWFYYSVGNGGTINSIDTISPYTAPTVIIGNGSSPSLKETYANSTLSVSATFQLTGSSTGSGTANLTTTIGIYNPSGTAQTYHFYQYSDFSLGGVSGGQSVAFAGIAPPYNVVQTGLAGGPFVGKITSISGGTGDSVEEQAGIYDGTQFGLISGNTAPITLNTNILSAGVGNVDFAYEIDATVAAGSSVTISELQTVPEPSSPALISLGILGLAFLYRRRLVFLKNFK